MDNPKSTSKPTQVSQLSNIATLVIIFVIAMSLRLWYLYKNVELGLGYDELQTVTYAYLPLSQLVRSVMTLDPHPPLYYIMVHFWLLLGSNDGWLKYSSVLISMLTVLSLYYTAGRVFTRRVGLMSALFFAISPFAIFYAVQVRMYAWIMLLAVWSWYFTNRIITSRGGIWTSLGLFASLMGILYSHGAGFLVYTAIILYAILETFSPSITVAPKDIRQNNPSNSSRFLNLWRKPLIRVLVILVITLILYIPWMKRARIIGVEHTLAPNLSEISQTLAQLWFGTQVVNLLHIQAVSILVALLTLVLIFILVQRQRSRWVTVAFVLAPLLTAAQLSHFVRAIWLERTLSIVIPFLSLGIGLILDEYASAVRVHLEPSKTGINHTNQTRVWLSLVILLFFLGGSIFGIIFQNEQLSHWWHIKDAVQFVRQEASTGEVIYVPAPRVFWGWCWYYINPGCFNPLDPHYSLDTPQGVRIVTGSNIQEELRPGGSYWVAYRHTDSSEPLSSYPGVVIQRMATFNNFFVDKVSLPVNNGT